MKKIKHLPELTERLKLDLEELAENNPDFAKEVRGIARNYKDDVRRQAKFKDPTMPTVTFFQYYHQYSIVKKKIENKRSYNPKQFKLWDNRERN